jgi:hypothetical protein
MQGGRLNTAFLLVGGSCPLGTMRGPSRAIHPADRAVLPPCWTVIRSLVHVMYHHDTNDDDATTTATGTV